MEKERKKHLRKTKAIYYCLNAFFVTLMVFIILFSIKLHINIIGAVLLDLVIAIVLFIFNWEIRADGIENISNRDLTIHLLSDKPLVEVIPIPLNSSHEELKKEGTHNSIFGNIHENLVKSAKDSHFFAKLSAHNSFKEMELVEIYRHFEKEGPTFVGYVKPEYFLYFYDLKELK